MRIRFKKAATSRSAILRTVAVGISAVVDSTDLIGVDSCAHPAGMNPPITITRKMFFAKTDFSDNGIAVFNLSIADPLMLLQLSGDRGNGSHNLHVFFFAIVSLSIVPVLVRLGQAAEKLRAKSRWRAALCFHAILTRFIRTEVPQCEPPGYRIANSDRLNHDPCPLALYCFAARFPRISSPIQTATRNSRSRIL